jgi:CheY-like chemotaxis protein
MYPTVLVIDDQWSMLALARLVLQRAGYRVLLAGDAPTGLYLARAEQPDLVLVDIHLPGIDGPALIRRLRAEPATCDLPVVFITAGARADQPAEGARAGAVACLAKPFAAPVLVGLLERVLMRQAVEA